MASTGVNVLRWSTLGAGVLYGFYHQTKLTTASKLAAIDRDYKLKEDQINKAKAEFAKRKQPKSSKPEGAITDPENPKFDLEALLKTV
ncbi:putative ATP synthase subunit E, mitochondrial [Calycina marina]|uniref:ATP synthase F(0) complex subunit e, mitochondrial n=1 Tax=Calycina marina TaxID=1763456 RepID=A0A9P7YXB4_9HELO|nr:putative ATP synthase subunit E, mitochondrial [Calycina marina]